MYINILAEGFYFFTDPEFADIDSVAFRIMRDGFKILVVYDPDVKKAKEHYDWSKDPTTPAQDEIVGRQYLPNFFHFTPVEIEASYIGYCKIEIARILIDPIKYQTYFAQKTHRCATCAKRFRPGEKIAEPTCFHKKCNPYVIKHRWFKRE